MRNEPDFSLFFRPVDFLTVPAKQYPQFDQAINKRAKPEIQHGAKIDRSGVMLSGEWQVRRQKEINGIAQQDCGEEFQPFSTRGGHAPPFKRYALNGYNSQIGK